MPNINYANINIGIQQFQDISTGEINAGEVRLRNENSLDMINNHAHKRGSNKTSLSHREVLAIKNAFVRSLSECGVGAEEINRVRQELGLAPRQPVDRSLLDRSIKPLSRQQIREILDHNAATINANVGPGTIRTTEELQARVDPRVRENRRSRREEINAELPRRRALEENRRVAIFQSVIAGDVDFHDDATRRDLLAMAKRCLETVLVRCHGQPRTGQPCEITRSTTSGASVTMDTGHDEAGFVRKLEEMIVRLSANHNPLAEEMAVRREFKALPTQEARERWIGRLWGSQDPQDAFKARVVAVMVLHDRGIDDAETLSIANRLDTVTAISFAVELVQHGMDLEGDALRNSDVVRNARAAINPDTRNSAFVQAYVPALPAQAFNDAITAGLHGSADKLPETFQLLLRSTSDAVRARYGADGYPDAANFSFLVEGIDTKALTGADNPDAPRITPETLRDRLMEAAVDSSARRFMYKAVGRIVKNAGLEAGLLMTATTNSLRALHPEILQDLVAAQSPEEAAAVMERHARLVLEAARRTAACKRCEAALEGWAREEMGERLGVPAASLANGVLAVKAFDAVKTKLREQLLNHDHPAKTDAEIEAVYRDAVRQFADDHMAVLGQIDRADIPPAAKDAFKATVLAMEKVKDVDVGVMVNAAKSVSGRHLLDLLDANAPKDQVYGEMAVIMGPLVAAKEQIFAAARARGRALGPDENANILGPMVSIVVLSQPGLEGKLSKFLARDDVRAGLDDEQTAQVLVSFLDFRRETGANADLVAKIGTDELPALHAKAIADAVRAEAGLEGLTNAEALALFKTGTPACERLRFLVQNHEDTVYPSTLGIIARAAIRPLKAGIIAARGDAAAAAAATREFLDGPGAARALQAGFLAAELPRLAKLYAFYKAAAGATAEDALAAVLDPASKASRLMSYGGRFAENVENFRAGLRLLDSFGEWYDRLVDGIQTGKTDTPTLVNGNANHLEARHKHAHERFIFEEIAVNPSLTLSPADPEDLFGMKNNPATRFVGRNYMESMTNTLAGIPPARRSLLYAVFDAMAPLKRHPGDKSAGTRISMHTVLASRVLKNYDAVAALRDASQLDRAHIIQLLFSDFGIPPNATNQQIYGIYSDAMFALSANELRTNPELMGVAQLMLEHTGATKQEVVDSLLQNQPLPNAPFVCTVATPYEQLGDPARARASLLGDLHRAEIPTYTEGENNVIPGDNAVFQFRFPDGQTLVAKTGNPAKDPEVAASGNAIADKVAALCGNVHPAQVSAVYYALSQSGLSALKRGLVAYGINSNEHTPVTFTLERDTQTGDVTIRYREPEGFPIHFGWQTTIHLDGSGESTPMTVQVPPDFAARRQATAYARLAGLPPGTPLTSSTIVTGNGPAANAMRDIIDSRSGAPEGATATEKATAFATRLNAHAAKEMAVSFATVASRNLVTGEGPGAHVDVEKDHAQLKRDLISYRYHFPGGGAPTHDYNEVRDRFVQFLTGRRTATFAGASEAVKKRVTILMSLATQYTVTLGQNAVASSMARPGENPMIFAIPVFGGAGTDLRFAKDPAGNIRLTVTHSTNAQMVVDYRDLAHIAQHKMPAGSTYKFQITITLPEENLSELAEADWAHFDRKAVNDFDGPMDERVALIPEPCRFKGTVDFVLHLDEAPANAPAQAPAKA